MVGFCQKHTTTVGTWSRFICEYCFLHFLSKSHPDPFREVLKTSIGGICTMLETSLFAKMIISPTILHPAQHQATVDQGIKDQLGDRTRGPRTGRFSEVCCQPLNDPAGVNSSVKEPIWSSLRTCQLSEDGLWPSGLQPATSFKKALYLPPFASLSEAIKLAEEHRFSAYPWKSLPLIALNNSNVWK